MTTDAGLEPEEPTGDLNPFVLKHGDMFVVGDALGDIHGTGDGLSTTTRGSSPACA